jgi:hypothetical protein
MKSSNPQVEHLKRMLNLEEKRAALQEQVSALDEQIGSLKRQLVGGGAWAKAAAPAKRGRKPGRPPKAVGVAGPAKPVAKGKGGGVRGQLAARIVATLKAAGSSGITVKNLSDRLKANYRNIQVWFATTGKKNSSIKKIAPATYKLVG